MTHTTSAELLAPSDDLVAFAITETFGERCSTADADCYTYKAWAQYDRLAAHSGCAGREEIARLAKSASGFSASAREGAAKCNALDSRAASETYLSFADQFQKWAAEADAILALRPAAPELKPWRDELSEIIGHLGSAITQSVASDDQIIMDHVKAAHEIAKIVGRKA